MMEYWWPVCLSLSDLNYQALKRSLKENGSLLGFVIFEDIEW